MFIVHINCEIRLHNPYRIAESIFSERSSSTQSSSPGSLAFLPQEIIVLPVGGGSLGTMLEEQSEKIDSAIL